MRNFGNDAYTSQHYHHPYQQLAQPPPQLSGPRSLIKMEQYPLAKVIGVGASLKAGNKSHFLPVNGLVPSRHHQTHPNSTGSGHNNSMPINLSHGHTVGTIVPPTSVAVSHAPMLPIAALAAACPVPTANRGTSPVHQLSVNGFPHHPSHSPTLPVATTALPSESHVVSSGNSNSSSVSQLNSGLSSFHPYHHPNAQNLSKMGQDSNSGSSGIDLTTSSNNQISLHGSESSNSPPSSAHGSSLSSRNSEDVTLPLSTASGDNSGNQHASNRSGEATSNTSGSSAARIVSQNVNGTFSITGIPKNDSELQLFRVLQRANLLGYFDMMIELGGDDVQQLCEAGEGEFLEIMALIGMAAKPLHVRRLQKALQEWMTQPSLFQSPVLPPGYQHLGVSQMDRTISHTQYTTTTIASSNISGMVQPHHPLSVMPVPQVNSHNPNSPYSVHNPPQFSADGKTTTSESCKIEANKSVKLFEHGGSSPTSNLGIQTSYLARRQGSPPLPVVISTNQSHSGQGQTSNLTSSEYYANCPSPSGSTSSQSSGSTISISSHHHQQPYRAPSPMELLPGSPAYSESGQSNKHDETGFSSELENSPSPYSDHTNFNPALDGNSTGTTGAERPRVASRCSSQSSHSGSEPSSPGLPMYTSCKSTTKGIIISQKDSPHPSSESVTNRNISSCNNSVTTLTAQDFTSLQDHEIQKLAETAMNIVRSLPPNVNEPKLSKKIETSSYELILRMADDDPQKMDEIRRLSAIFGKQERRNRIGSTSPNSNMPSKPVSILELFMNEAAAQLCNLIPALVTKRDELFGFARQVIRESGLPYAIISANSNLPDNFMQANSSGDGHNNNNDTTTMNKAKISELRNSPTQEERISHEFAAACKKLKLDMNHLESQENNTHGPRKLAGENGSELRTLKRKSLPSAESNIVTATALKRMALVASEFRRNCKSTLPVRT